MASTRVDELTKACQDMADRCREVARGGLGVSPAEATNIGAAMQRAQAMLMQLEPTSFVGRIAGHVGFLVLLQISIYLLMNLYLLEQLR